MKWIGIGLVIAACSTERKAAPVPTPAPSVARDAAVVSDAAVDGMVLPEQPLDPPLPAEADATGRLEATFGPLTIGQAACFYFSGPNGRDVKLDGPATFIRKGDQVWLRWGPQLFIGTLRDDVLDVRALTAHMYEQPWTVDERLRGVYRDHQIRGHYTYEECEQGGVCPGPCTISAAVLMQER